MKNYKNNSSKIDNIKNNLMIQVNKLFNESNQNGFKTRYRYLQAEEIFCSFLAEVFHLQKICNVKEKHIISYVNYLKEEKKSSSSTIMTELSWIRFFHALSNSKNLLPGNKTLNLEKRKVGRLDRAWSQKEINKALALSKSIGRLDVYYSIKLALSFGLRLEEVVRCNVGQLKDALPTNNVELVVKGKGGQIRSVPTRTLEQAEIIALILEYAKLQKKTNSDMIIPGKIKGNTRAAKKAIQNWIINHRKKFMDGTRNSKGTQEINSNKKDKSPCITFHGLRHYYASSRYNEEIKNNPKDARTIVSEELGHHRESITSIYLNRKQKSRKKPSK